MTRLDRALFAALALLGPAAATLAQTSPEDALRDLLAGNRRFVTGRSEGAESDPGRRRSLARGQGPLAVVVTCADSQAAPERVFDARLGDLVVVRTAGHVLGPDSIVAVERAVDSLRAPLVLVLAHERCSVLRAAGGHGGRPLTPVISQLLARLEPALRAARAQGLSGGAAFDFAEEERAHATVHECLRISPPLRTATRQGRAHLVAARLRRSGEVEVLPHRPLPARDVPDKPVLRGFAEPALAPQVALRLLTAGHRRFLSGAETRRAPAGQTPARQQPLAVIVSESDARAAPELLFDADVGDLFVIRGAGTAVDDEALASLEFAASQLGAPLVVFLRCGGSADSPDLSNASDQASRAVADARARSALLRAIEREGRLAVLGVTYDLRSGDLTWVDTAAAPRTEPLRAPDQRSLARSPAPLGEAARVTDTASTPAPRPKPAMQTTRRGSARPSRSALLAGLAALAALLAAAWLAARSPR